MRYAIVIEEAGSDYGAYVPRLPGCVATGNTVDETLPEIREAIAFHIEEMRADGLPIPEPSSRIEYIEVAQLHPPPSSLRKPESFSYTRHSVCRSQRRQVLSSYFGSTRASPAANEVASASASCFHCASSFFQSR